ncbi:hypothetical protein ACFQER_02035 [Halomicroarcula sp. GCM10025894]|uniref:hypothetical protein n=1 Tax=Halomicroarcula sp. GCM10025894 TaxID=3252673 RepID=UPI003605D116
MLPIGTHLAATVALVLAAVASTLLGRMRRNGWDELLLLGAGIAAVAGFLSTFDYRFLVAGAVGQ